MGKEPVVGGGGEGAGDLAVLAELFQKAKIGRAMKHEALTIHPIFTPDGHVPNYILLEEALEKKVALITESNASGNVPELLIVNDADAPVLVLEGDVLMGAKQNRVVNVTVLVAAHSKFTLPVSCVERGRWNYVSQHFSVGHSAHMDLRRSKTASVLRSKKSMGKPVSDQMDVWNKVDECLEDVQAASPTSSLHASFASAQPKMEAYRKKMPLPKGATGFIVAVADKVIGLDLFGESRTAARCWERLSESYMLEALRHAPEAKKVDREQAEQFMTHVGKSLQLSLKTTGLGQEIEVEGFHLTGMGLVYESRLVHLAAFANNE